MPVVRLLGPVDVVDSAGVAHAPNSPIRATILALLAFDAGQVIGAEQLLDQAWDGTPPDSGLRALRFHVSRLRAELSTSDLITTVGSGYRLAADTDIALVLRGLDNDDDLASLIALWRGPPLADCSHVSIIEHEQQRLAELRLTLNERYYRHRLDLGEINIIGDLTRLCLDHPARESLWAILVSAHYHAGNQAQALRTYDQLRRHLRDELGINPTPDLQQLEHDILDHDPTLRIPVADTAASASAESVGAVPMPTNNIVGRVAELAILDRHLHQHRLVTVLGPGGIGKTRFALEAVIGLQTRHPDGVWFCDLSSVENAASVPFVVAAAFGVNEHRGRSLTAGLLDWIGARQMLLVLDNCEQVRAAACAFVDVLFSACPQVQVLATSREPLRYEGEQRFPLGPLDPTSDAVDLFCFRASMVAPGLDRESHSAAIAEICRLVEGIPLAIELAVARTAALSPEEIAVRLRVDHDLLADVRGHRPDRQRSLGTTIDWSTSLLTGEQQRVLAALGLFSGGFTLPAAEAVCADLVETNSDLIDTLTVLVECSLADKCGRFGMTERFRMLEPIRQHVVRELPGSVRADLSARHAHWFARRAQELQGELVSPDEADAMDETTAELANFRQAHRWALEHDPSTAGQLVSGLVHYEISRMHTEIIEWFDQTLAVLDPGDRWFHPTLAGATVGWTLRWRHAEAREAYAMLDDTKISPFLRDNAAMMSANAARYSTGDLTQMERLAERALEDGDWFMAVLALGNIGRSEEALAVANRSRIPSAMAYANMHAARAAARADKCEDAEQLLTRAVSHARSVHGWMPLARALAMSATIAERLQRDPAEINRARAESAAIFKRSGLDEQLLAAMRQHDAADTPGLRRAE